MYETQILNTRYPWSPEIGFIIDLAGRIVNKYLILEAVLKIKDPLLEAHDRVIEELHRYVFTLLLFWLTNWNL